MQITEQWILSRAPGPAVAKNGRTLSEEGRFASLRRSSDGLTYWAECAGSAKNPYYVSADWSLSEEEPVYNCSCSSPHFPCKHVLGLLYEMLDGKTFDVGELPAYVLKARAKQEAERARIEARLSRVRRREAAGREKKLKRQLEGLAKAERKSNELLRSGVAALHDLPAQTLERLATELGNCDLPGARDAFERIALLERRMRQEDADEARCRSELYRTLAALRVLTVRARELLAQQRIAGAYAMEDPALYELLGGAWDPDELREIGLCRRNARLVQLSFDTPFDELGRMETERAFWLELSRGDIVHTLLDRSERALPCERAEDSCFELLEVPSLYETPAVTCPRVWWDGAVPQPLTEEERASLRDYAAESVAAAVSEAKRQLREALLPLCVPVLITVGTVGRVGEKLVLCDRGGGRIALRDRREDGAALASTRRILSLPAPPADGDALFGILFYDEDERSICLQPYSLVTAEDVVRLQF